MMLISSKNELHPGCYLYSESTEKKVGDILNSSSEKFDNNFFGLAIIESEKLNDNLFVDTNTRHRINIVEQFLLKNSVKNNLVIHKIMQWVQ